MGSINCEEPKNVEEGHIEFCRSLITFWGFDPHRRKETNNFSEFSTLTSIVERKLIISLKFPLYSIFDNC